MSARPVCLAGTSLFLAVVCGAGGSDWSGGRPVRGRPDVVLVVAGVGVAPAAKGSTLEGAHHGADLLGASRRWLFAVVGRGGLPQFLGEARLTHAAGESTLVGGVRADMAVRRRCWRRVGLLVSLRHRAGRQRPQ